VFGTLSTIGGIPPEDFVLTASPLRVGGLVLHGLWLWAGIAVLGGWMATRDRPGRGRAAVGGAAAQVAAVVAYYLVGAAVGSEGPPVSWLEMAIYSGAALVVGPLLGVVGGLSRRTDLVGLLAGLVVPVAGLVELLDPAPGSPTPDPARAPARLITAALVVALTVAVVLRHRGRRGSAAGAALDR